MSFFPVFALTVFCLCLQSNCCSRFCLSCLFRGSKEFMHSCTNICSSIIMLNQYYIQQFAYAFILVISHSFYLLRSHIPSFSKGLSLFFPIPQVCHETFQSFVLYLIEFFLSQVKNGFIFIPTWFCDFFFSLFWQLCLYRHFRIFCLRKKLKQTCLFFSNMLLKIHNQIMHAQGKGY